MSDKEKDPQTPGEREGVEECQGSPEPDAQDSAGTGGGAQSVKHPADVLVFPTEPRRYVDAEMGVQFSECPQTKAANGWKVSTSGDFLKLVHPSGPWVLTAIAPDRKNIETQTFTVATFDEMLDWIAARTGRKNLYWEVNPPRRSLQKKARKEDIARVTYLHCDIDARAGENLLPELGRMLALVTTDLPTGALAPTITIFSGGGYQIFYKLAEPIELNGDLAAAEEAERYNRHLEMMFGGDNVHDVSRIMRLPFTLNIPDERKTKKGRVPVRAELIDYSPERAYPISMFVKAPPLTKAAVQDAGALPREPRQAIAGDCPPIGDLNTLDAYGIDERAKIIIAQGRHPNERKANDDSRSAWLFDVLCHLARAKVPDEIMLSLITDKGWGISESVLDKGRNYQKYALRQIERAKEHAIDPWLVKLNDRFAVIGNLGGRCRVIEEVMDAALGRPRLTKQSFDDFRNRFCNEFTQTLLDGKLKRVPVGHFWINHAQRRQYESITFAPARDVGPDVYNLWRGFAFEPKEGDLHQLYLEHLRENVCQGDAANYDYLLKWMARGVQRPGEPAYTAVVLQGERGVGKSIVAEEYGKLFGRHYMMVNNPSHLIGNFNSHLRDVVVLFADEAFLVNDKKHESVLKTLVTADTIPIEAKGIDVENAPNYIHLMLASNDPHVIPAGFKERRFFVLNVGNAWQGRTEKFRQLHQNLEAGGFEHLLHFLQNIDLTDFQYRKPPDTAGLQEQQNLSLAPVELVIHNMLSLGEVPCASESRGGDSAEELFVPTRLLVEAARLTPKDETTLGKRLAELSAGPDGKPRGDKRYIGTVQGKRQVRGYWLPRLEVCRQRWEAHMQRAVDWPADIGTWGIEIVPSDDDAPF